VLFRSPTPTPTPTPNLLKYFYKNFIIIKIIEIFY